MGTCRRRFLGLWLLFWSLMAFELCASLNHEGAALLKFKEAIDADPYGALLDWDEGSRSPCSWFGVECSGVGRVMSLNLANLGLSGILPPEIGNLMHMHSLILQNNSFYGTIPTEIGDLQELKVLDLGYNNFSGPIPSVLRNILSLKFLFLKGNRLSGGLPVELHEITRICESQNEDITWLNRISTARLLASKQKDSRKDKIVGSGSPKIANLVAEVKFTIHPPGHLFPESPKGSPFHHRVSPPPQNPTRPPPLQNSPLPPPPSEPALTPTISGAGENQNNKRSNSSTIYASIGAAIGFVVVSLSAVCFFYYCRRKTSTVVPLSAATSSRQLQTSAMEGITIFRRSELEKACEGFSNIIGTLPGFTLYKGTLPCGAEIAVVSTTVAYAGGWSPVAEAHYIHKVEALSKVNHKNLMNLVGHCEDEKPLTRMMVFENFTNYHHNIIVAVKEAEHLDWRSRLRIAMGVLYCLDYMHQQNNPVTLRNLNSSCIYLTEDDAAKVSDISFSVGKKEDDYDDEFDVSDEYNTVYKFALLLLETISGRRPYSDDYGLLVLWAHGYLNGVSPVMGMVDPTLNSVAEEHIRAFSELIHLCISEDQRRRPTMAELTKRMQEITGITQDQAIPRKSALWWAELEIITE
ncbi:Protein MALE DISCOVERER 2 [Dichanthelium oligosanthes]|uniref:Protein MALE DISCOVERER 2 n=1 Tax=Dichanthelium oligosanthes TaxID=888268 RepID=A0A1E5UI61_9POAL|nr:Protein MALE DISCOVERER 2 [Dichanthelium oligosanthes]